MDGVVEALEGLLVESTAPDTSEYSDQPLYYSTAKKGYVITVKGILIADFRFDFDIAACVRCLGLRRC